MSKKKSKISAQTKYFCYPAAGGTKSVGVGDLTIDFYSGKVTLPDGTEEFLSSSLKLCNLRSCESILIRIDKSIDISFDGHGRIRVTSTLFGMNHMAFKTVYLHILEASSVSIFASNSNVSFFFL